MRNPTSATIHATPEAVLSQYRLMALVGCAAALALVGLLIAALEAVVSNRPSLVGLIVAGALPCLVLLGVFWFGYRGLKHALAEAEIQRREHVAAINRDALTGAMTRGYFLAELKSLVRRSTKTPLAFLQFDMDHLKSINDGLGHAAGDAALQRFARVIAETAPDAIFGRLGGDEFAIAIPGIDSKAALRRLGEHILARLDTPVSHAGRDMRLSATIGVAVAPEDGATVDVLMSKADLALYKGKRSGRSKVIAFEAEMLAEERHQRFIERELRTAILLNELELFYQPVFGAKDEVVSVEALVRWKHPVRGLIPPSDFVPIAEQGDLIDKLGEWVLRRACRDIDDLAVPAIAVNVSAAELRREGYADRVAKILKEAGVSPQKLIVEVTETAPLRAGDVERINLRALRETGIRIAIDDFGAGHASLAYLRNFPFDCIKIDRTYIANMLTSRVDAIIVQAVARLARVLDVDVVAEGIETMDQREAARQAGCAAVQGYLLARPMPLDQCVAFLSHDLPIASAA
ncbi:putative bifunctional diguanylate cyclase/phosphodiesterase [Pelagibacterium halotolerans]|uniref:putative bifunctional diguanylate cyclase/phosphodiesterase n=1 Tax=Pelagibacterium halotolerans TaxID=531813 RepID=UPI00384E0178